jgi:predicted glutamine amidotransferase
MGMNCNVPTDICFSFRGFHQRGGRTADHADGFGVAFFLGPGCRMFVDSRPAADSPVGALIATCPIRSQNVIAHIRKATRGAVALVNTHPFMRELWERYWIFAHNGTLENFSPEFGSQHRPVGSTDSEHAFCRQLAIALPGRATACRGIARRDRDIVGGNHQARKIQLHPVQWRLPVRIMHRRSVLRIHSRWLT